MRIDLNPANAISASELEKGNAPHISSTAEPQGESEISLSDGSVGALAVALNAPETRTQKVDALRSQIEAGTYQVSPGQIAASVLEQLRTR